MRGVVWVWLHALNMSALRGLPTRPCFPAALPPMLQQLIDGCNAALAGYPTTIDEDLALLNG